MTQSEKQSEPTVDPLKIEVIEPTKAKQVSDEVADEFDAPMLVDEIALPMENLEKIQKAPEEVVAAQQPPTIEKKVLLKNGNGNSSIFKELETFNLDEEILDEEFLKIDFDTVSI